MISWKSSKQSITTNSTIETKYIVASYLYKIAKVQQPYDGSKVPKM